MKWTYQFTTPGIYTDSRRALRSAGAYLPSNIVKLQIPLPRIGRFPQTRLQGLKVDPKREVHFFQKLTLSVSRNANTCTFKLLDNFLGCFAGPFTSADGVPGGFVFHNRCNRLYDFGRFFPVAADRHLFSEPDQCPNLH